jgi:hypothetical protein
MASGGLCGHGVMRMMLKRLGQYQAQSALRNTERKCQQMTKTLAWPDAGRRDGLSNATLWWLLFLGVDMKKIMLSIGKDLTSDYAYLKTRNDLQTLPLEDQRKFFEDAIKEMTTAIRRIDFVLQLQPHK